MIVSLCVALILFCLVYGQEGPWDYSPKYEGSKVFRTIVRNDQAYHRFLELRRQRKVVFLNELIWGRLGTLNFLVHAQDLLLVDEELSHRGIYAELIMDNFQDRIDRERGAPRLFSENSTEDGPFDLTAYPLYDEILQHVDYYANDSEDVSKLEIGKSLLDKPIVGLKFDRGGSGEKPVVFFECGIHAREWISVGTCAWMINEFASNAEEYDDILDVYEIRIFPSVNPDGYEHSSTVEYIYHLQERMWRKNRRPDNSSSSCEGVDLNRNFDAGEFCGPGTSDDPCEEIYCGVSAFSEPESQALKEAVLEVKDRLQFYISLHSFGQYIMYPYARKEEDGDDDGEMKRRADAAAEAIEGVSGKKYTVGPIAQTLYACTGTSVDWAYEHGGARYSFTIELPPEHSDPDSFVLMPEQIIPIANETLQGIRVLISNSTE